MKAFTYLLCLVLALSVANAEKKSYKCRGKALYEISFRNLAYSRRFRDVPSNVTLALSPMLAASHSPRQSVLVIRSYASPGVELIAEQGDNSLLRRDLLRLRGKGVRTVSTARRPTLLGKTTTLRVKVDCEYSYISALSMIAPSPDWIVAVPNFNTVKNGRFIKADSGNLFAYDSGTDDGREFTPPDNLKLDLPTKPQQNIVRLSEDETDRFDGRFIAKYYIKLVKKYK